MASKLTTHTALAIAIVLLMPTSQDMALQRSSPSARPTACATSSTSWSA